VVRHWSASVLIFQSGRIAHRSKLLQVEKW
jgi:hypothetical protein